VATAARAIGIDAATPPAPSPDTIVVRAALVLALVGVALAVNRIVRILGYGWVAALSHRLGMRALTASATAGAPAGASDSLAR
jgi:hypothetical protein